MLHNIIKSGLNPIAEKQINDNFRNLQREAENKGKNERQQSIIYLESVIPASTTESVVNYQLNKRIFFTKNNKTTISATSYCWGKSEFYSVLLYINDNYIHRSISFYPNSSDGTYNDVVEVDITQYIKENDFNEISFYFNNRISFDIEINATIINE